MMMGHFSCPCSFCLYSWSFLGLHPQGTCFLSGRNYSFLFLFVSIHMVALQFFHLVVYASFLFLLLLPTYPYFLFWGCFSSSRSGDESNTQGKNSFSRTFLFLLMLLCNYSPLLLQWTWTSFLKLRPDSWFDTVYIVAWFLKSD